MTQSTKVEGDHRGQTTSPILAIIGSSDRVARYLDEVVLNRGPAPGVIRLSLKDGHPGLVRQELVKNLSTSDMFDKHRIVIGQGLDDLPAAEASKVLDAIRALSPQIQGNRVILSLSKKHRSKRINVALGQIAHIVVLGELKGRELEQTINAAAKKHGIALDDDLLTMMLRQADGQPGYRKKAQSNAGIVSTLQAVQQLGELLSSKEQQTAPTAAQKLPLATVKDLKSLRASENSVDVFGFIDAFFLKNTDKAHQLFAQLLANGESPVKINALLASQARKVILALRGKLNVLKVHPFVEKKARQQARHWTVKQLNNLVIRIEGSDCLAKSGGGGASPRPTSGKSWPGATLTASTLSLITAIESPGAKSHSP